MSRHVHRKRGQLFLPLPVAASQPKPGARRGRKPKGGRRFVRHRVREPHSARHPVHVVLRSRFKPLRSQFVFPTLRRALAKATRARADFRITQFSVQGDHVHLIVEAESASALSRGMQGLAIRIARAVNALVNRRGKVWADRFFSRELSSPRATRNALAYVLNNFLKHRAGASGVDPYSSAPYFQGFASLNARVPRGVPVATFSTPGETSPPGPDDALPILQAKTWLGRAGWRRGGAIERAEAD